VSLRKTPQVGSATTGKADFVKPPNRRFFAGLGRAFGGAILFSLPLMMTMEMWSLGFYMGRLRLALLMLLTVPLLTALAYYSGFKDAFEIKDQLVDAFVAYAVGFVAGAAVLILLALVTLDMSLDEIIGKVALQAVPGGIGAVLAVSQLGGSTKKAEASGSYVQELFIMLAGALFFSLNVAPTEEMVLISYKMTDWHALVLVAVSVVFLLYQTLALDEPPPEITFQAEKTTATTTGFLTLETSETTLDYVPAHSKRQVGLFFTENPAVYTLVLSLAGKRLPKSVTGACQLCRFDALQRSCKSKTVIFRKGAFMTHTKPFTFSLLWNQRYRRRQRGQ